MHQTAVLHRLFRVWALYIQALLYCKVASPRGDGGSDPTYVQTPPEISANPLKSFCYNIPGLTENKLRVYFR